MGQFRQSDFVSTDTLSVDSYGSGAAAFYVMSGEIGCQGNIIITVDEILDVVTAGEMPEVCTSRYSYNVRVFGQNTAFRYDNFHRHDDHPDEHHKHIFDFSTGTQLRTEWIGKDGWPTLSEVIEEARSWWSKNHSILVRPDEYPLHSELAQVTEL